MDIHRCKEITKISQVASHPRSSNETDCVTGLSHQSVTIYPAGLFIFFHLLFVCLHWVFTASCRLSVVAVFRPLPAAASLVVEHGL